MQSLLEATSRIGDIGKVTSRGQSSQVDRLLASSQLRNDGRNHRTGRLTRTVGVERANCQGWQLKRRIERANHLVCTDFRGRVWRLTLKHVAFIHGHILGGAIDLRGRGVNEPANPVGSGRVQEVQGALHVGLNIHVWRYITKRDGDQGRQVHHGVLPGYQLVHVIWVANVAENHVELFFDVCRQGVEPTP